METPLECARRLPDAFPTTSSRLPPWPLNPLRMLGLVIDYLPFGRVIAPRWGCNCVMRHTNRCPDGRDRPSDRSTLGDSGPTLSRYGIRSLAKVLACAALTTVRRALGARVVAAKA